MDVGSEKQLFIDRLLIGSSENVELTMNRPRKAEVALHCEKPWESHRIGYWLTVMSHEGVYKMWYGARDSEARRYDCYATSEDGIRWVRPNLGIVSYDGSKDTNIIRGMPEAVALDPNAPPERRFIGISCGLEKNQGVKVCYSADGLHWDRTSEKVFPFGCDSVNQLFRDDRINKYVAYLRKWDPLRKVGRVEMDDPFKPWPFTPSANPKYMWKKEKLPAVSTEIPTVFSYDEKDPVESDHYNPCVIKYAWANDIYFMFPSAYYHYPPPPKGKFQNDGRLDIQMATSRDGIHWNRIDRRPFVRLGPDGSLEGGCLYMGIGMLRTGDEISMYYTGYRFTHGDYDAKRDRNAAVIRRAVIRLDGFVSADAAYTGGELTTKPFTFSGDKLVLNIDTSAIGHARVGILDESGKPYQGFSHEDCDEINGDYLCRTVTWNGSADVASLSGKVVKLQFVMRCAKLYSFQFVPAGKQAK